VAAAAPFTPRWKVKIKSGSRRMFAIAPIATENIPVVEYPCALIKGFMPVAIMDGSVPSRYSII